MKKRRFPFIRSVTPRVPKRVLGGWLKKCRNLKFQMGITGAPFGRTELLVPPLEPQERDLARGKGPRVPGGWGVGKNLKNVTCLGHFVFELLKNGTILEIGQICSDWAHIDSEQIPASSFRLPGGGWANFSKT